MTAVMVLITLLVSPFPVAASLSVDEPMTVYAIDFSSFLGSGFAPEPTPGQLDSDTWRISGMSDGDLPFGGTAGSGDYAKGLRTGNVGPSGIYAFEVSPGVVTLGVQPSNVDFTPGEMVLRIQNGTTDRIIALQLTYDLWVNNNRPYATHWGISHSADDLLYTHAGGDYTSGESADALGWQMQSYLIDLQDLSIEHEDAYYLKWSSDDVSGHGQRDEFGLNNITLSATVTEVNYPPRSVDDGTLTAEDTPVLIDVLANDSDPDLDTLLLDSFTQPAHGAVARDDNGTPGDTSDDRLTYTPETDWSGDDSFSYTSSDGNGDLDTATVDVSVTAANDPPDAVDDSATTPEDSPITLDVIFNDSDPDGDPLLLDSFTQPTNGTATRDDNGTPGDAADDQLTYTPDPDWNGDDSFTYTIGDGHGETDTATIHVSVVATYPYTIYLPLIMR